MLRLIQILSLNILVFTLTIQNAGAKELKIGEQLKAVPDSVAKIVKNKCTHCHMPGASLPFYTQLPGIKGVFDKEIEDAQSRFDIPANFWALDKNQVISEKLLAAFEGIALSGAMPPAKYTAIHWDKTLNEQEKKDILEWVKNQRTINILNPLASAEFKAEPIRPLPNSESLKLNLDKLALGKKLYDDKRLSHDNTISCASCHDLAKGGTDQSSVSTGIQGQKGDRNAPTVFNSGFMIRQFWDGRAADLEEQAAGPINNPIEMGSNWDEVLGKLAKDGDYKNHFARLGIKMSPETVTAAIAEYERSLVTPDSRFDRYLKGDKKVLSEREIQGYKLFKKHRCSSCHFGPAVGGQVLEKMGYRRQYHEDLANLKVPTLRNVAVTYPYFHDGSVESLEEAVFQMGKYQTGIGISAKDVDLIVEFLHTLTGEYQGVLLK